MKSMIKALFLFLWLLSSQAVFAQAVPGLLPSSIANAPGISTLVNNSVGSCNADIHGTNGGANATAYSDQVLHRTFGALYERINNGSFWTTLSRDYKDFKGDANLSVNSQGFSQAFAIFFDTYNQLVLAVIIIWMVLQGMGGFVTLSVKGKWDDNISSTWAGFKILGSVSALAPLFAGYSLLQGLIMFIILGSSHATDRAACALVAPLHGEIVISQAVLKENLIEGSLFYQKARTMRVCQNRLNEAPDNNDITPAVFLSWGIDKNNAEGVGSTNKAPVFNRYRLDMKESVNITYGQCGSLTLTLPSTKEMKEIETSQVINRYRNENIGNIQSARNSFYMTVRGISYQLFNQANKDADDFVALFDVKIIEGSGLRYSSFIRLDSKSMTQKLDRKEVIYDEVVRELESWNEARYSGGSEKWLRDNQSALFSDINSKYDHLNLKLASFYNLSDAGAAIESFNSEQVEAMKVAVVLLKENNMDAMHSLKDGVKEHGWIELAFLWQSIINDSRTVTDSFRASINTVDGKFTTNPETGQLCTRPDKNFFQRNIMDYGDDPCALDEQAGKDNLERDGLGFLQIIGSVLGIMAEWIVLLPAKLFIMAMTPDTADITLMSTAATTATESFQILKQNPVVTFFTMGRIMLEFGMGFIFYGMLLFGLKGADSIFSGEDGISKILESKAKGSSLLNTLISGLSLAKYTPWAILWKAIVFVAAKLAIFFIAIGGVCLMAGFMISVVLPYTIIFTVLIAVAGYVLMVIQAFLATPIWAGLHANLQGQGLAHQSTQQGYQLLTGLVLRPLMIVGSILFVIASTNAITWLYFELIQTALPLFGLDVLNPDHKTGMVNGFIASSLIIMSIFAVSEIFQMNTKLINTISDEVLAWIGGGRDPLGGSTEQSVGKQTAGMMNVMKQTDTMGQDLGENMKSNREATKGGVSKAAAGMTGGALDINPADPEEEKGNREKGQKGGGSVNNRETSN